MAAPLPAHLAASIKFLAGTIKRGAAKQCTLPA
jgi:hypothetical protein